MKKKKQSGFIVFFDDEQGLCVPYGWDGECEGAIESSSDAPVIFESRSDARKAIRISTANARLRKEQGLSFNDDFTPACAKCLKIRSVVFAH